MGVLNNDFTSQYSLALADLHVFPDCDTNRAFKCQNFNIVLFIRWLCLCMSVHIPGFTHVLENLENNSCPGMSWRSAGKTFFSDCPGTVEF